MPHVIVKMLAGRSDKQKRQLADEITKAVMKRTGNTEDAISVSIEDVAQKEWTEKVYNTDSKNNWDKLFKRPGYKPL